MSKLDETLLAALLTLKTSPQGSTNQAINRLSVDLSLSPKTLQRGLKGQISDATSKKLRQAYADLDANKKARVSQAYAVFDKKHGRGARLSTLKNSFKDSIRWGRQLAKQRELFNKRRARAEKKGNEFALRNLSILGGLA